MIMEKQLISERHIQNFSKDGFIIIRKGFLERDIQDMRERLEDIIKGQFVKNGRRFQPDTESGLFADVDCSRVDYRGPDVAYRKIADLEYDNIFLEKLQSPWIREICGRFLGPVTSVMRVTMMNKPARGGTPLPWHQDVSLDWPTSVQPELAVWFALDKSASTSGSLQVIPGSHLHGVIGRGHLLPSDLEDKYAPNSRVVTIKTDPGDVLFFHGALLHRSGVNYSSRPRRAINAILMPGQVIHLRRKRPYPVLHGENELLPEGVAKLTSIP